MSITEQLSDPRLVLFVIYGLFVVMLLFCSGTHFFWERFPWRRNQVASDAVEPQSEGIIYELFSATRKNEIDALRESIFDRLLGNFTMTLKKEHMVQRGRSGDALDLDKKCQSTSDTDTTENDIEEGSQNNDIEVDNDNDNNDNDNDNELDNNKSLEEEYTHIVVPQSGVDINGNKSDNSNDKNDGKEKREVPIFCAICLSEYEISDKVCWSSYSHCTHVFHKDCITQWLVSLGRRRSKMRRFPDTPSEKKLLNYELECPCCRQEFIAGSCGKVKEEV